MLSNPGCKRSNLHTALNQADLKIFIKDVRDKQGRKRPVNVRSWSTVKDVKDQLYQLLNVPPSSQRLFFGPINDLPNHRTLNDAGIYRSGETLLFDIRPSMRGFSTLTSLQTSDSTPDICVSSVMNDLTTKSMRRIVQRTRRGLDMGLKPEIALDGSGGTYFLRDARKVKIAAFKPSDEEPYAPNNPRGYIKGGFNSVEAMRAGINPGEACVREVAAFLTDHGGFSGVPMTTLVEARHPAFHTNGTNLKVSQGGASSGLHSLSDTSLPKFFFNVESKVGSCQEFIMAECTMDDLSPSLISVEEVHKIAILDIRLMNADRNSANLLCKRIECLDGKLKKYTLTPIDHGYCLRSACDVCWFDWCWLDWPQLKEPLSKKSRSYIMHLNIESDIRVLKERLHIQSEALDIFRASCKLLQAGIKAGLTLYEVALMCCRYDDAGEIPSKLEIIMKSADDLSSSAVQNGRWHHSAASSALVDQLHTAPTINSHKSTASLLSVVKTANGRNIGIDELSVASVIKASETGKSHLVLDGTSCSDSSDSSDKDLEDQECDEWAKLILDKVSIGEDTFVPPEKTRPLYLRDRQGSSGNLSTSPTGFWHLHPDDMSDGSVEEWDVIPTPPQSPPKTPPSKLSLLNFGGVCETFVGSDSLVIKPKAEFMSLGGKPKGMKRSQSYSSFSLHDIQRNKLDFNRTAKASGNIENDQYRVYFTKFVDLLIERETKSYARYS